MLRHIYIRMDIYALFSMSNHCNVLIHCVLECIVYVYVFITVNMESFSVGQFQFSGRENVLWYLHAYERDF